jgi:DNA gyrase/topoisomerase IV subunit B
VTFRGDAEPGAHQVTGGRNGYGAKLANIFSKEFVIETCDGQRQRRYRQVFRANMTQKDAPAIRACKASENWTCVTFCPDLAKFGAAGRGVPRTHDSNLACFSP